MNQTKTRQFWRSISRRLKYVSLKEFEHNIHISLLHNYMYVETPKVACSSLKLTLGRMELNDVDYSREDIHNRSLSPLLRPSQAGDFDQFLARPGLVTFCFVRNPYERFLSAYLNKIRIKKDGQFRALLGQLGLDQTDQDQIVEFETFVTAVEETPVYYMDSHWRPQYYQTFQESLTFDHVGKLENFQDDLARIAEMISADIPAYLARWDGHQTGAGALLDQYYTPSLRKRVHRIYEMDFDTFAYSGSAKTPN